MKKLMNLKGAHQLSRKEQQVINGGQKAIDGSAECWAKCDSNKGTYWVSCSGPSCSAADWVGCYTPSGGFDCPVQE